MSSIISLTVTPAPPTPSSGSQPPPPPSNDSGTMQRGANYFFGFLITFVALLLIFIAYGVGTRRRFAARRRAAWAANFGPWGDGVGGMTDQPQPAFWEPFLTTGGDKWSTMLPLSTTLLRPTAEAKQPLRNPTTFHRIPLHIPSLLMPKNSDTGKTSGDELPETLQVAVMIVMPSPEHTRPTERDEDSKLEVYQIGVARIPWEGKDLIL